MDLRKIIALTLVIPALRVSTGAELAENNATEAESGENHTKIQEEEILKKIQEILNDSNLKEKVLKSIYEPEGLRDNYDKLMKELNAPNDEWMSYTRRAHRINEIIKHIDDPILKAIGRNILLYSENIGLLLKAHEVILHSSPDIDRHIIKVCKEYASRYIQTHAGKHDFPCIPPSVAIEFMPMKNLIEFFNTQIDQNYAINIVEKSQKMLNKFFNTQIDQIDQISDINIVEKTQQMLNMLDEYNKIFSNMQTMKKLAQSKVAKESDANRINHDKCKTLIATKTMSIDIVNMIFNDEYLKDLITKEVCKLSIVEIEKL